MASFKIANKLKRQSHNLQIKKQRESTKRDERLRRRRAEDKNPRLREERRARNVPKTIDAKRTWDEVDGDDDGEGEGTGRLGVSVDVLNPKRRKVEVENETKIRAAARDHLQPRVFENASRDSR